ncbi:nucleotidyltransferase domain-containing protein [Acaryochloris marina NIES-2412]|uniref:nucleotidyltransferase domain-containing protein n=1 Tax=Acaryochloris marina TaxID=155978 RepID=UPI004058BC2B
MVSLLSKRLNILEFTAELNLLLSCLPLSTLSKNFKVSYLIEEHSIDWNYFLRLATYHKVVPQVYQCLKHSTQKNIPDFVLANLRQQSCEITLKNILHVKELKQLISLFESHEIKVIPFKGPTLAQLAYGSIYARQFCDLDLLVQRKDFDRSINLLINHSYHSSYLREEWHQSIFYRIIKNLHYTFFAHEISFGQKRKSNSVFIDLHRKISKYSPECFDNFSCRLIKTNLLEQSIRSLGPEDLLNVICIHNSQDGWIKFQAIYDVANLVHNNPTLNWSDVFKQAQDLRCRRRLLLGLALCRSYFDVDFPESINNRIREDQVISNLTDQIDQRFKANLISKRTFSMKISFQVMKMKMLESFYFKVKVFCEFVWSYFFSNFYRAKIMSTPLSK